MAPPLEFTLSPDKKTLRVIPTSSDPFEMDALTTESLIHALIATRAEMTPRRMPADPFPDTPMLSHPSGMRWYAAPGIGDAKGHMQLSIAHPGFGWVGMFLGREGLEALMAQIAKALESDGH